MERFNKEDFEVLSSVKEKICISIYIPTHESGMEVNEGNDKINFKNEVQKIQIELERRNLQGRFIRNILSPCFQLLDDESFWKEQFKGLAVFLTENKFWSYRLPIEVSLFSNIGMLFELTPLISILEEDDVFYTLSLSQNNIKLFRNTSNTYEEVTIALEIPQNVREVFSTYEFQTEEKEKNAVKEGNPRTPGSGPLPSHGSQPQDDQYLYITEFLRNVNNGIVATLKHEKAPMVIAAVDNIFALYKKVNSYKYIHENYVRGNPDRLAERELHEKSLTVVKNQLNKNRKKALEKYAAWAGTGKTSYNLEVILSAAFDGRIECLFLIRDTHIWGKYDEHNRSVEIHNTKQADDLCLYDLAAIKTLENSGDVYMISALEVPEKKSDTRLAAIFRY